MTNTGRRFFSGNTLEQAVIQAASHYQIDPDEVAYRKIEKRHGFLKTRRGVVIDVDPDNPRRASGQEVVAPTPVEPEEIDLPRRRKGTKSCLCSEPRTWNRSRLRALSSPHQPSRLPIRKRT